MLPSPVVDLIDRIADLLRSLFASSGDGTAAGGASPRRPRSADPDVDRAQEELDEFLGAGGEEAAGEAAGANRHQWSGGGGARSGTARAEAAGWAVG